MLPGCKSFANNELQQSKCSLETGWMDGCKSCYKDCLQQSKMRNIIQKRLEVNEKKGEQQNSESKQMRNRVQNVER